MGMKTALVTGISGQDGSYLAELLLAKGYRVYGLVRRLSSPTYERISHVLDDIHLITGDLLDQSSLSLALDTARPDEVYNLAAMSHVGESFKQPLATAEYNGLGVLRLLEAIRLSGAPVRFYQASTSELFGNAKESPQDEETPFQPCSPYATAKLFAHQTVQNYRQAYGIHASCGILFNHESPRRSLDFVTRKIARGVSRIKVGLQDTIQLGNLNAYRDWGFAGDYVKAMWLMLQQPEPGDYVVATGETHSVMEFLDYAFQCVSMSYTGHLEYNTEAVLRPTDVRMLCGDASKARRVLGWEPDMSFYELVATMVDSEERRIYEAKKTGSDHDPAYAAAGQYAQHQHG